MIRRIRSSACLVLATACLASLTACPSAAPEGTPDDGRGGSASTGAMDATTVSGTPTSSGGAPTSSASTASGPGGDGGNGGGGGAPSTTSPSSSGGEGGGPAGNGGDRGDGGDGGDRGGTGGDPASNGSTGAGGETPGSGGAPPCGGVDLTSDGDHCGECGHSCLGGECEDSECQAVVLDEPTYPGALALDETHVWFIDEGTGFSTAYLMKTPKVPDAGDPPDAFAVASEYASSLVLTDSYVVWADFSEDVVTMSPRATSDPEVLTEELDGPADMAAVGDDVFIAASGDADRCIVRGTVETGALDPFPPDPKGPSLVVADDTYLYYVDARFLPDSTADIVRVRQDESERTVLVQGDLPGTLDDTPVPTDLALFDGMLYWTGARGLFRLAVDGGDPTTPEEIIAGPVSRVAVDASGIYWFTASGNTLHLADHEGNELRQLANGLIREIALDDDAVYWTETRDISSGFVKKLAKSPTE